MNCALNEAVKNCDIMKVRELLDRHPDPRRFIDFWSLSWALEKNYLDIFKLLVDYGAILEKKLLRHVFHLKNGQIVKDIITRAVNFNQSIDFVQICFKELIRSHLTPTSSALEILNILLDNGLPLDDTINDLTPLQHIIIPGNLRMKTKIDFVRNFLI